MKQLDLIALESLTQQACQSPRLRANVNLHQELTDPIQRLAIAMEPDTLVMPHRHPHTFEVLFALRGRFLVLTFDESGRVTARIELGDACRVVELAAGEWHAVLSLEPGAVIFEVKHGPYLLVPEEDICSWSQGVSGARLNAWYACANIGDQFI